MTVSYIGKSENSNIRLAEIWYDEKKEETKINKVINKLSEMGWEVAFEEEECVCYEMWDRDEYKEFVADYKKAKKEA